MYGRNINNYVNSNRIRVYGIYETKFLTEVIFQFDTYAQFYFIIYMFLEFKLENDPIIFLRHLKILS